MRVIVDAQLVVHRDHERVGCFLLPDLAATTPRGVGRSDVAASQDDFGVAIDSPGSVVRRFVMPDVSERSTRFTMGQMSRTTEMRGSPGCPAFENVRCCVPSPKTDDRPLNLRDSLVAAVPRVCGGGVVSFGITTATQAHIGSVHRELRAVGSPRRYWLTVECEWSRAAARGRDLR